VLPLSTVSERERAHREAPIEPQEVATILAKVALDMKAADVVLLDMRALVDYCDVFVICSATNRRQVQAIAEAVRVYGKRDLGLRQHDIEGLQAARWVLVDFGDVVVHVFDQPMRGFYNLDGLWSDAPRLIAPEGGGPSLFDGAGGDDDDDDNLLPQPG
jgi:ribosome-associated protein